MNTVWTLNALIVTVLAGILLIAIFARSRRICGLIGVVTVGVITGIISYISYRVFTVGPLTLPEPIFSIPALGADFSIGVDYLSAVFLLLIGGLSFLGTLYSYRYMDHYATQSLARFYHCLILFIVGMIGVVCLTDLFFFFVSWEFMTLSSYFLVTYEKEDPVNLRAGFKYFLMTHIGTAAMFIGALILQTEVGSFAFSRLGESMAGMMGTSPVKLSIILGLFLLGFGTKAGMFPVGTWLPDAHPAAPSGVSAMLSGVMIKMGIYGIFRFFFFLLPPSSYSVAFGIVIGALGAISIFMGTISALLQHDSKRLLAFHSIGQIGYILLGLGTGLVFLRGYPALAITATLGGMLHVFNHALFKGLLFLNAGSILYKTGTRDLNKLGGLYFSMPLTAWTTLIASFSIAGLPPFNGFISKWLIYETTILGGVQNPLFILFGLIAIFISTVTLASFIKFFTTAFSGEMDKTLANNLLPGIDVPFSMQLPQVILAFSCLFFGIFPWIPLKMMYWSLTGSAFGSHLPALNDIFGSSILGLTVSPGWPLVGSWLPIPGVILMSGCFLLAFWISRMARPVRRTVPLWTCGEVFEPKEIRFPAENYYVPLVSRFEGLIYPESPLDRIKSPQKIYRGLDLDEVLYYPTADLVVRFFQKFRKSHVGTPQVYLLYQVIGILILVAAMLIWLF